MAQKKETKSKAKATKKVTRKKNQSRKGIGGRKKIEVDWETINKLCFIQCTAVEIAAFLEVSEDTLSRRCKETHGVSFAEYIAQKREGGKTSLRRAQWTSAVVKGNPTMLIWLGKQFLGQSDKVQSEVELTMPETVYNTEKMSPDEYRKFLKENFEKSLEGVS